MSNTQRATAAHDQLGQTQPETITIKCRRPNTTFHVPYTHGMTVKQLQYHIQRHFSPKHTTATSQASLTSNASSWETLYTSNDAAGRPTGSDSDDDVADPVAFPVHQQRLVYAGKVMTEGSLGLDHDFGTG